MLGMKPANVAYKKITSIITGLRIGLGVNRLMGTFILNHNLIQTLPTEMILVMKIACSLSISNYNGFYARLQTHKRFTH